MPDAFRTLIVGGGTTSAAGGAVSLGQESFKSCDKYYESTLDRSMKENKKDSSDAHVGRRGAS